MQILEEQFREAAVLGLLAWNTRTDIERHQISVKVVGGLGVLGILMDCAAGWGVLAIEGMVPGILLLALSGISRGAVGIGDGLAVTVMGSYLGLWNTVYVLLTALFLSAFWAGFLLVGRKSGRGKEFPFLPFLLIGFVGRLILCII